MKPYAFDRIDVKILGQLQEDGRITNLELSQRVGLSPAPCMRRVKLLEEAGVIRRYAALLEPGRLGLDLEVSMDVKLKSQTRELMERFEKRIGRMPEVVECCLVAGEWDYSLRVLTPNLDAFQSFQLDRLMIGDSEIAALRSTIIMRKVKSTTVMKVEAAV